MEFTKNNLSQFREEFNKLAKQLEKKFDISISLGVIRFDDTQFSAKMTSIKNNSNSEGTLIKRDSIHVGDIVGIDHKKVNKNDEFVVVKINNKNMKLKCVVGSRVGSLMSAHPSFLFKK